MLPWQLTEISLIYSTEMTKMNNKRALIEDKKV